MKLILLIVLTETMIASAAVLPPALPLDLLSNPTLSSQSSGSTLTPSLLEAPFSNLPDNRFKIKLAIGAPLLPINSTLINVLYFMSLVAGQDFVRQLQPRTYSTSNYRAVQITTYAWTEARFLLWGIYYAINGMVKLARFNDVTLELYWEDKLVGKFQIAVKQALSLARGAGNLTQDLGDHLAQTNLTGSGKDTKRMKPVVGNVTESNPPALTFSHLNASTTLSLPPSFAVSFESIAGAGRLDRNDVFLTFYAALLHIAQFPAESQMQSFHSVSPSGNVHLHMQKIGIGCQYGRLIGALIFVPKYMMEHSNFGYRETDFLVKLGGEPACLGTVIKGLLPVERRSLEESLMG